MHNFSSAKDKIYSKSALQMLLDEGDMSWIMSMMFYSEDTETWPILMLSALAGAVFGSIHCTAWSFDFPLSIERLLWRVASLTIVGVCACIISGVPLYTFVLKKRDEAYLDETFWGTIKQCLEIFPSLLYSIARVLLFVLALLSLRDLPESHDRAWCSLAIP